MIRINLIPPEILQARRDERVFSWVWIGAAVVGVVLALFWAWMFLQVMGSQSEVAAIQQQAAQLQDQTARFAIFRQKEDQLLVRRASAKAALEGRIDWAGMLYEIGLVLPRDMYLTSFTGVDAGSGTDSAVTFAGRALNDPSDTPDAGYKPIAKMLVRIADLTQLRGVWLANMSKEDDSDTEAGMILFSVSAKVAPGAVASSTVGY